LINSAYNYVLEFKRLPFESARPEPGRRTLDPKRLQELTDEIALLQVSSYDFSNNDLKNLKEILAERLRSDYEVLT
jgi:hypothetical protein